MRLRCRVVACLLPLIHIDDDAKIFTQRCALDRIITEFIHVTHRKGIVNLRVALYCYRHLYRCDTPAPPPPPLRATPDCVTENTLYVETCVCARNSPATLCPPNNRLAAKSQFKHRILVSGVWHTLRSLLFSFHTYARFGGEHSAGLWNGSIPHCRHLFPGAIGYNFTAI